MDVKQYYKKVREAEAAINDSYPLVMSLETSDGGRAGLASEVSRELAAKMIVEGRAVLASEDEQELYRQQQAATKRALEKAELARRVQVAIITDSDLQTQVAAKKNNDPSSRGK